MIAMERGETHSILRSPVNHNLLYNIWFVIR